MLERKNIPAEELKKLEMFIAKEIKDLSYQSIWADPRSPRQLDTEEIQIDQIINYVNLRIITQFRRARNISTETLSDVYIERLCMKPIVPSPRARANSEG